MVSIAGGRSARSRAWGLVGILLAACASERVHEPDRDGAVRDDAAVPDGGAVPEDAGGDAAPDVDTSDVVFARDVLHEVAIEIDPARFDSMDRDRQTRVPSVVTYDGVRIEGSDRRLVMRHELAQSVRREHSPP